MPVILPNQTDLYALTDSRLSLGRPVGLVTRSLLESGIRILQYREKKASPAVMLAECRLLRRLTREFDACFIVNDHVDLALLVQADGVHVGQEDQPLPEVRKLVGARMCIGLSTHSPAQAAKAVKDGADYIGVGPIFATRTKEDVVPPVGFAYLRWVAENISLPFVAIGGIKVDNIAAVAENGARCCALVSGLVGAEDIPGRVASLRHNMRLGLEHAGAETRASQANH